ncbi:ring finger protein-like [Ahaetulla prasina]|uniref:ring finger protein-like n=1 Tax=Ahaetulla prasina TaxID=499056 RepID=UPI00264A39E9|nr:ring finger protein-like [Ahaetulla prasina]
MGTIPSDSALGGTEPAVLVLPEKEVSEFRAAPSLGNVQQGLLQEERTGAQLIEDGSEGKGPRTEPAADDLFGSEGEEEEEEPSIASPVWHPKFGLGELGVDSGESPVTEEACGPARLAILGQEEETNRLSGNAPQLPLGEEEEEEEMEGVCLLGLGRNAQGAVVQSSCIEAEDPVGGDEQECPICTELYDQDQRKPALLNCSHVLCSQCLQAILQAGSAADIGRVRCPICRQKTPMMEWEICKLQEELLLLSAAQGPAPPAFSPLPPRQPGFWGGLEHHFHVRFHTSRVMGFFPCLRYPACLVGGLAELERRCPWCYRTALLALATAEMLSLLLVFLPILLLLLLFLILDK